MPEPASPEARKAYEKACRSLRALTLEERNRVLVAIGVYFSFIDGATAQASDVIGRLARIAPQDERKHPPRDHGGDHRDERPS